MKRSIGNSLFCLAAALCASSVFAEPFTPQNYSNAKRVVSIEYEIRNPTMIPLQALVIPLEYWKGIIIEDFISDGFRRRYVDLLRKEERKLGQPQRMTVATDEVGDWLRFPGHGINMLVDYDNAVVENKITKVTLANLQAGREDLDTYLFKVPSRVGLNPATRTTSAGHIHLDMQTFFKNDPLLFLNFVTDFVNHPGLSSGAWAYDPSDAKRPLFTLAQRAGYMKILEDFDAGRLKTIPQLQERMGELKLHKISGSTDKSAINVRSKFDTVELRGIRGYKSVQDMLDYVTLLNLRMDYLEKRTAAEGRLPFLDPGPVTSLSQVASQHWSYVTEAGGDWKHFREMLPPSIRRQAIDPENAFKHNPRASMSPLLHCRMFFIDVVSVWR